MKIYGYLTNNLPDIINLTVSANTLISIKNLLTHLNHIFPGGQYEMLSLVRIRKSVELGTDIILV